MKYAFLIARQRSGTGALGSVLGKHPQLKYIGEVFHPNNIGQDQNFFTFLRDSVQKHPDEIMPDQRYDVFLNFLEDLAAGNPDQTLIVDIKYRSLHHLDGGWRGLVARPTALVRAIADKVPILHLTRRNALHSFVSGRLAEENKVWHTQEDANIKVTSTVINVRQLSNYVVATEREIGLVEEWIRKYRHHETFDYDDMFDVEGLIQQSLTDRIAKLLGVEGFDDRAPSFIKQAPSQVSQSIENYDLVKRSLTGTEFSWMLD